MKRSRAASPSGLTKEADELIWLAKGSGESASRSEDAFWDALLAAHIDALLHAGEEDLLGAVLDYLHEQSPLGYEALADMLESRAESGAEEPADGCRTVMIAAPILAWSRFSIPARHLSRSMLDSLRVQLSAHVLAKGASLALADALFSPDQLPQGFCETARFAAELNEAARNQHDLLIDPETLPETGSFLSDVRYILAAVSAPADAPLFRWQERDGSREQSLQQWRQQGGAVLAPLLTGCSIELVLPDAFFAASRSSDLASRPYSLRASVQFLSATLEVLPSELRAVIAPYYEHEIEEYRIGFTLNGKHEVLHGVVWPLLGQEDENSDTLQQIENNLKESGLHDILRLNARLPIEFCDDCGTPLYPSPDGESVHAELPSEQVENAPRHLH